MKFRSLMQFFTSHLIKYINCYNALCFHTALVVLKYTLSIMIKLIELTWNSAIDFLLFPQMSYSLETLQL